MFRRLMLVAAAMLALTVLLAACGEEDVDQTPANGAGAPADSTATASPTELPADDQPDLDGTNWQLSGFADSDIDLDVPVTLGFEDGQASGNAGCNDYGAEYTAEADGTLSLGDVINTEMDCEMGMDVESEYLDALRNVKRYVVDDTRLELLDASGSTLLVFMREETGESTLDGTSWILSEFEGEAVPEEFEDITLNFNDGEAGGTVCNSYGGSYELGSDNSLSIFDLFQTEMYCTEPEGIMDFESEYVAALGDVAGYRIEGGRLTLLNANDDVLMTFTADEKTADMPLDGTEWVVTEIDGEPVIEDSGVTMEFENGMLSGNAGCNSYGGSYSGSADGELELRDITMTLMACAEPDGVMDQETAFLAALREVTAWEQDGDDLRLLDDAGDVRLMLVNASNPNEPVTDESSGLIGTSWFLTAIDGQLVESVAPYTLQFTVNGPTGKAGCMSWWMQFTMEPDGTITHETRVPGSTHDAFCDGGEAAIAEAEAYVEALSNAASYAANEEHMQLLDADGMIILEFQRGLDGGELEGTSWTLTSMNDAPLVAGTEIMLEFEAEHAVGNGGCNGYGGPYMVVDQDIVVLAEVNREEMACVEPEGVMEQETEYFDTLLRVVGYKMTEESLTLMDADGETILTYEPVSNDT